MNDQAARILASLVTRYGTSVALDPLRCEGLLRDTCPRCNREIFVLVNAVRQQVPADLLAPRHSLPPALFRGFLVKRLQDELAFSDEAAHWAVDTWAGALGLENGTGQDMPAERSDTAVTADTNDAPGNTYIFASPEQRALWVEELESASAEVRVETVRQLADGGDNECIRIMIACLENTSWKAREAAFDALVGMGGPAVPHLIEALSDSHEHIIISSIIALGTIRSEEAVDPLISLLESGSRTAAYIIWALGEIGDQRAVTPLLKFLNSRDSRIRSEAERALKKYN